MVNVIVVPAGKVTTTWNFFGKQTIETTTVSADWFQVIGTPVSAETGEGMEMEPLAHVSLPVGSMTVPASTVITTWTYENEHVEVPLTFFQNNGTPVSAETGENMQISPNVKIIYPTEFLW